MKNAYMEKNRHWKNRQCTRRTSKTHAPYSPLVLLLSTSPEELSHIRSVTYTARLCESTGLKPDCVSIEQWLNSQGDDAVITVVELVISVFWHRMAKTLVSEKASS